MQTINIKIKKEIKKWVYKCVHMLKLIATKMAT